MGWVKLLSGGEVTPDLYIIDKKGLAISNKRIGKQAWKLIRNPTADDKGANIQVPLLPLVQAQQKLSDDDISGY